MSIILSITHQTRGHTLLNTKNTEDFMERLIKTTPFKIERLQTDNGIEFTFKWASKHYDDPKQHRLFKICYRESINHKLIPPGEKELQGLVERSHRQDLFSRIVPKDSTSLIVCLRSKGTKGRFNSPGQSMIKW